MLPSRTAAEQLGLRCAGTRTPPYIIKKCTNPVTPTYSRRTLRFHCTHALLKMQVAFFTKSAFFQKKKHLAQNRKMPFVYSEQARCISRPRTPLYNNGKQASLRADAQRRITVPTPPYRRPRPRAEHGGAPCPLGQRQGKGDATPTEAAEDRGASPKRDSSAS